MGDFMTFKVGETVRLKSGGPLMTVVEARSDGTIFVSWFNKDEDKKSDHFPADSLEADDGMPPMPSGGGFRAPV
jgi:uncharacterized protein YodC (DUF2158 family)